MFPFYTSLNSPFGFRFFSGGIKWEHGPKIGLIQTFELKIITDRFTHSFSPYAKFSEKLIFLTTRYAHARVRIRG